MFNFAARVVIANLLLCGVLQAQDILPNGYWHARAAITSMRKHRRFDKIPETKYSGSFLIPLQDTKKVWGLKKFQQVASRDHHRIPNWGVWRRVT